MKTRVWEKKVLNCRDISAILTKMAKFGLGTLVPIKRDMTVAIDEDLEGLDEVSGDKAGEVKKELF